MRQIKQQLKQASQQQLQPLSQDRKPEKLLTELLRDFSGFYFLKINNNFFVKEYSLCL